MPSRRKGNIATSLYEIDLLLAGAPKPTTLKARIVALRLLCEDINYFSPWPALVGSLNADITRLRDRLNQLEGHEP